MGLEITAIREREVTDQPTVEEMGGRPDLAIFSYGRGPRHLYFFRAIKNDSGIAIIKCSHNERDTQPDSNVDQRGAFDFQSMIKNKLAELVSQRGETLNVFIDVSCLARSSIAEAFVAIGEMACDRPIRLSIGYSLAKFAPPPIVWAKPNRSICPVHPAFSGWTIDGASAPLDIVVGLGYEKGKALGAAEYLEPRYRWVFVPESPEEKYLDEVQRHNKQLIKADLNRVLNYQVMAPVDTFFSLRSLVEGMTRDARPVMLPFGPKIFFAVSLLVAMSIDEAAVWHVDGENEEYSDRNLSKHSVVMTCTISAPTNSVSSLRF